MTTIATDGRTMAGDTLCSANDQRTAYLTKVRRAPDGRIFGASGNARCLERFARWMTEGGDSPELDDEFEALVLNVDGTVDHYCEQLEPIRFITPMAIGSGEGLAIGAMLAGKSPAEAVAIAIERDVKSGGEITVLERTIRSLEAA